MQPPIEGIDTIDPKTYLERNGQKALHTLLAERAGYVAQPRPMNMLVEAIESGMPVLYEGWRGCGKTDIALSLAKACNAPLFFVPCKEGYSLSDIMFSWETELQNLWIRLKFTSLSGSEFHSSLSDLKSSVYTQDFLRLGEALGAYVHASQTGVRPILVLDEIDKFPPPLQDALLDLVDFGFTYVPGLIPDSRVGLVPGSPRPVVILTSNNLRHGISPPLRSRCVYCWFEPPEPCEEVAILRRRVPEAPPHLLKAVVKLLNMIRKESGILEKPGIRESISFLKALVRKNYLVVDKDVLDRHLGHLAKQSNDQTNLSRGLVRFQQGIRAPHPEFDAWVDCLFPSLTAVRTG